MVIEALFNNIGSSLPFHCKTTETPLNEKSGHFIVSRNIDLSHVFFFLSPLGDQPNGPTVLSKDVQAMEDDVISHAPLLNWPGGRG